MTDESRSSFRSETVSAVSLDKEGDTDVVEESPTVVSESAPPPETDPEKEPPPTKPKSAVSFFPDSTVWSNDIRKVILSEESQEQLDCIVNKHVFVDKPWRAVRTQKVLENIEIFRKASPFRKLADKFKAYKDPEVLMGYNALEGEENEFLVCVTGLGRDVILKHLKQLHAIFHERMKNAGKKVPRPWASLGSEEEIGFDVPKNNRPLLTFEWVGDVLKRYNRLNFVSVDAGTNESNYTTFEANPREHFDHVSSIVVDKDVQAGAKMISQEVQTSIGIPVNMSTMISPEIEAEELKDVINGPMDETPIKEMFDRYIDKLTHMLAYNNEYDLYNDDYEFLHQAGKLWKIYPLMRYRQYVTFSDAVSVKGLYITSTSWHPNLTGVVAVSYGKDVIAQEKVISSDSDDPDYVPTKKDHVIDQKLEKMGRLPEEKSKSYPEWSRHLAEVSKVYEQVEDTSVWEDGMRYINYLEHSKKIRKREIHLHLEAQMKEAPAAGVAYEPKPPVYNVFVPPDLVPKEPQEKKKKKKRKKKKKLGSETGDAEEGTQEEGNVEQSKVDHDEGMESGEGATEEVAENVKEEEVNNENNDENKREGSRDSQPQEQTEGESTRASENEDGEGTHSEGEEETDESESDKNAEEEVPSDDEGPRKRSASMQWFMKDVKLAQPGGMGIPSVSTLDKFSSPTFQYFCLIWGSDYDWQFGRLLRMVADNIHENHYLQAIQDVGQLPQLPSPDLEKVLFPKTRKSGRQSKKKMGQCCCNEQPSQKPKKKRRNQVSRVSQKVARGPCRCNEGQESSSISGVDKDVDKYRPPYLPLNEYYSRLIEEQESDTESDSDSEYDDDSSEEESQSADKEQVDVLKFTAYDNICIDRESDEDFSLEEVSSSEDDDMNEHVKESFGMMNPVLIWSLADDFSPQLKLDSPSEILSVAFCPHNGNYIVGGSSTGQVLLWDVTEHLTIKKRTDKKTERSRSVDSLEPLMRWQKDIRYRDRMQYTAISYKPESHSDKIRHIQWVHPLLQFTSTGNISEIVDPTNYSLQVLSLGMDGVVKMWDLRSKPRPKMYAKSSLRSKKAPPPRPPRLLAGISPYIRLDKRWVPFYWIKIADRRVKPEKVSCIAFDNRVAKYALADPLHYDGKVRMDDIIAYNYVPTPVTLMDMDAFYGNLMGEVGYIQWVGASEDPQPQQQQQGGEPKEKKPSNTEMVQALSRFQQYHDGAVAQIARHPIFPHIALSGGGHTFCLWHTGDLSSPIKWKRYSGQTKVTALSWSPLRPSLFRISRSDGYVEIWDLLLQSHAPKVLISIGGFSITALSSHILPLPKGILGIADAKGVLNFFYIPWVYQTWEPSELDVLQDMFDREPERRGRLKKWREEWAKFHFPKDVKESAKRSEYLVPKKKKKHYWATEGTKKDNCARAREEVFKWYLMRRGAAAQWLDDAEKRWFSEQQQNMIQVIYQNKHWDKESLEKAMAPLLEVEEKERRKQEKINSLLDQADERFLHALRQIFSSDASIKTMSMISMRIVHKEEIDFSKALDEIKIYFGPTYRQFDKVSLESIKQNQFRGWRGTDHILFKHQVTSDLFHEFSRPESKELKELKASAGGILKKHNLHLTDLLDRKELYFHECLRPTVESLTELKHKYGIGVYREFGWYMLCEATEKERHDFLKGAKGRSEFKDPPSGDPFGSEPPTADPPPADPPTGDPPTTDATATDPPPTDAPPTDPPTTDPPSADPPTMDTPETDRFMLDSPVMDDLLVEPNDISEFIERLWAAGEDADSDDCECGSHFNEMPIRKPSQPVKSRSDEAREKLTQQQRDYLNNLKKQGDIEVESEISKFSLSSTSLMDDDSSSKSESTTSKEQAPDQKESAATIDSVGFTPDQAVMDLFPEKKHKDSHPTEKEEEVAEVPTSLSKECSELEVWSRQESLTGSKGKGLGVEVDASKSLTSKRDYKSESVRGEKKMAPEKKPPEIEVMEEIYVYDPDEVSLSSVSLPYSDTSPADASDISESEVELFEVEDGETLLTHGKSKALEDSPEVSEMKKESSEEEEEPTEEVLSREPEFMVIEDEPEAVGEEQEVVQEVAQEQGKKKKRKKREEGEDDEEGEGDDEEEEEEDDDEEDEEGEEANDQEETEQ